MQESEFHQLADRWLNITAEILEEADEKGLLEAEYENGTLNLVLPSKKTFVISKHVPTRQLWLSSPVSGGLHFSYDAASAEWKLSDGRRLNTILSSELETLGGVKVAL